MFSSYRKAQTKLVIDGVNPGSAALLPVDRSEGASLVYMDQSLSPSDNVAFGEEDSK